MSEYGVDPRSEEGFFSYKREALVQELMQLIFDRGVESVLDVDVHMNTLSGELQDTARKTLSYLGKHTPIPPESAPSLALAMESGMALASWTHGVSEDKLLRARIKKSLHHTAELMDEAREESETLLEINREYEALAQYTEANDETAALIEQELQLVDYCSKRYEPMAIGAKEVFKTGYGMIRRAARFPYAPETLERSAYNLNYLGINAGLAEKFREYCDDDIVTHTTYDQTFNGRLRLAEAKYKNDPYVRSFLTRGMRMSLIGGICRIEKPGSEDDNSHKYHAMGGVNNVRISGTVETIVGRRVPSIDDYDRIKNSTKPSDGAYYDQRFEPGAYVLLTNATWISGAEGESVVEFSVPQNVLVPLGFSDQELIYQAGQ